METNAKRATIKEVAAEAGVSAMTVSRVINETGPVAEETTERVLAAISALNYIPHRGARALALQKTNTVGLIFPEINDLFFFQLMRGIQLTLMPHGYDLLLYSTARPQGTNVLNLPLGQHNTDGLIIFTNSLDETALQRLHSSHFPMVLLHRTPPPGVDIPSVSFENKDGAVKMVQHLLRCGHRRIAFLAGAADNEDSFWREAGYREALAAAGIPFDPLLLGVARFEEETAVSVVTSWLKEKRPIDAIFAADDVSARGAIRAVQMAGLAVPNDIAIVGFDDALLSQYTDPPLTTVKAPIEEAGRAAAQQLLRLINMDAADTLTLLPTELVIRQSCGWQAAQANGARR